MTHGSEGHSTADLREKIEKLGLDFARFDDEKNPDDAYILDQFIFFVFAQDVAKDVYDDAKASKRPSSLRKQC